MNPVPAAYKELVQIPLPGDDQLSLKARLMLKLGAPLNVSRMFAGTGDMFGPLASLVKAVFEAEGIDPKVRELIVLRCSKLLNCPYEWQANATMGKNVGLSKEQIDAVAADGPVSNVGAEVALICVACDELTLAATLTDETLSSLRAKYSDEICRKLIITIGWFNLLSRFLNACRVPLETEDKVGKRTSPL